MKKLSRRDFLQISTRISTALVLSGWFDLQGAAKPAAAQDFPAVCVSEGEDTDTPEDILKTALEGLGGMERFVKPGQKVVIKPNATWAYPPKTASSTDPDFLKAVIQAVRDAGVEDITVLDHCSIEPGADEALRISGIGQAVQDMGVEYIFPDRYNAPKSTYTTIDLPHGQVNHSIDVIKAAAEADVRINLAVAKSHNVTKMTMCLKHMMGFLQKPGLLHANLEQGIADLSTPSGVQAQLHILEALRVRIPYGNYRVCAGPENDITHPHIVTRRNTIVAGTDPVLVDAYGCIHFFDVQPQELTHLQRAHEIGCGDMDVEAALEDGRIRRLRVRESVVAEEEAVSVEETTESETASLSAPKPTATPLIVSGSADLAEPQPGAGEAGNAPIDKIIAAGPILNYILFPLAAILTGLGMVILRRMRSVLPEKRSETPSESSQTGSDQEQ
ncbi:MAG: DUF362 domain-containing protein [Anaerolineales bacterium]|nr:DUF362 domain-containing protein [Anaerolineales bacterium]